MGLLDGLKKEDRTSRLCRAVIAVGGRQRATFVFWTNDLVSYVEEEGFVPSDVVSSTIDKKLDQTQGLVVWEATNVWLPPGFEETYGEWNFRDESLRDLTPDEWAAVQAGKNPWPLLSEKTCQDQSETTP